MILSLFTAMLIILMLAMVAVHTKEMYEVRYPRNVRYHRSDDVFRAITYLVFITTLLLWLFEVRI